MSFEFDDLVKDDIFCFKRLISDNFVSSYAYLAYF